MNLSKNSIDNIYRNSVVEMKGIVKHFPGVTALDGVDLVIEGGKIYALLGENGAGKTTLMNILNGIYQPDKGEIKIHGKKVKFHSSKEALRFGISMVHQNFTLIPALSVIENMALSIRSPREPFLDMKDLERLLKEMQEKYGLEIDPAAKVSDLSVGEKQRVEIIRALSQGSNILILDEPTSVLTHNEVSVFFEILRRISDQGTSVIFISHKLEEVLAISDQITVLRKGKITGKLSTSEATREELARLMVGRSVIFRIKSHSVKLGKPILTLKDLVVKADKERPVVNKVSFTIHEGEIFGIAGVSGNGQRELAEAILGLQEISRGQIIFNGEDVTSLSTEKIQKAGIGMIPEEILVMGIVKDWTLRDNLILQLYSNSPFAKSGPLKWLGIDWPIFRNENAIDEFCNKVIQTYDIIAPGGRTVSGHLSGGNLQKLVVAREILRGTKLLIGCHPTRGLDVGAVEYIRSCLLKYREYNKKGSGAILLVSEDLEELKILSDRIGVMYEGEIVDILPPDTEDEQIGLLMGGGKKDTRNKYKLKREKPKTIII